MIHVTAHAITRYQERVAAISDEDVRARIARHESALSAAVRFGAPCVRTAEGVRFLIRDRAVVTVLGPEMRLGRVA